MDQGHLRFPVPGTSVRSRPMTKTNTKSSSKCAQSEQSTSPRYREKNSLSPMLPTTEVDLKSEDQRCMREESEDGGDCVGWLCRRFCPTRAGCVHIISGKTFKRRVAHLFTRPAFPHCRVYYIRSFID